MRFYLGTHMSQWLGWVTVPLFVSRRRLTVRTRLPRATCRWALDSGGFTEISTYGRWQITTREYVVEVRRFRDEIGKMDWAAPQDWMCEPWIVQKTGLSVREHQRRTIDNFMELRTLAPDVKWTPVLQGYTLEDYLFCVYFYQQAGVRLADEPLVGLGSICRRQATDEIVEIVKVLHAQGLNLHGFGVKILGLPRLAPMLSSADSMAWSLNARKHPPLPGHTHVNCGNCLEYALLWRKKVLERANPTRRFYFDSSVH